MTVADFPSPPQKLDLFAILTDGEGDATIQVVITRLDIVKDVYRRSRRVQFPDRLAEVRLVLHISDWSIPAAGNYLFSLLVDGDWVAHRRLRVLKEENE